MSAVPYAKRIAYCANARNVGRLWRHYLQLVVVIVALLIAAVVPFDFVGKQFVLGFGVGACAMAMVIAALRYDDPVVAGHLAETFSVEALRRARGWTVFDNLPFDRVDVDHVVVTPAAVLAVESKWHGASPTQEIGRARMSRDCANAHAAARKLRSLLRSYGLHDAATVTPVLMVWGPGAPDLAEGFRIVDGVYVVDGNHPYLWRHRFSAPLVAADRRVEISDAIRDFAQKRANHTAAHSQPFRRQLIAEFRSGVDSERRQRVSREALRRVTRRRHGMSDAA